MEREIKSFPKENMPYERFLRLGAGALTEAELLAVILRTGVRDCPATMLAEKVLQLSCGSEKGLNALHHLSLSQLMQLPGIGEVKAVKLKCIAELSKRMAKETAKETLCFQTPHTVADYFMEELRHEEKETVLLLSLDTKLHLLNQTILSIGTLQASLVCPREVFLQALKSNAASIVLLHNHPSGDPTPSKQDFAITEKMKEAGKLLDIPLIDHIIIGNGIYRSMKEDGFV